MLRLFMRSLRVLLVAAAIVLSGVWGAARFVSDGPLGIFPGGALRKGPLVREPVADWTFATAEQTAELQLVEPLRSRTVWLVVHEGALYIPCGFLNWPLWKQWPYEALADGRAVLRLQGKRYEVQAQRVESDAEYQAALRLVARKYAQGRSVEADDRVVWFFRLDPRPGAIPPAPTAEPGEEPEEGGEAAPVEQVEEAEATST